ncbi:MAG: hypothetical protein WEB06_10755 [Actinomycetota bacterium]
MRWTDLYIGLMGEGGMGEPHGNRTPERQRMIAPRADESDARSHRSPPTVLVENPDLAELWADERLLRRAGFAVATCPGPQGPPELFPRRRCLLVDEGMCPLAARADVIVFGLGLGRPKTQAVLRALRTVLPATPVCVEAPQPDIARHEDLVRGCERIPFPATRETFVGTINRALESKLNPLEGSGDPVAER